MASNPLIDAGTNPTIPVASEEIASNQYQKIKLIDPTAGSTTGHGIAANPIQVSLANTATNATAVKVDGSAVTQPVSGSISISGVVDTELPTAAALADTTANPTTTSVGALNLLYNGTTWDRIRGDTANGLDVDVTRVGGNVTVVQSTAASLKAEVVSTKSNNSSTPGSTNLGTLPAVATTSAPSYTNNNQVSLSTDLSGNARIIQAGAPSNVTATGTLNALNAAVTIAAQGLSSAGFEIDTGTLVGTVDLEASFDGTNYVAVNGLFLNNTIASQIAAFPDRGWFQITACQNLRLRVSAYTSGSSAARIIGTQGTNVVQLARELPAGFNIIGGVYPYSFEVVDTVPGYGPVMAGVIGSEATPTAVTTDGNLRHIWCDTVGRIQSVAHEKKSLLTASGTAATNGNNTIVAALASNRTRVYAFSLSMASTTAVTCIFQNGAGGAELWRCVLQAPALESEWHAQQINPPSWLFQTSVNTLLNLNLNAAITIHYSVAYFQEP